MVIMLCELYSVTCALLAPLNQALQRRRLCRLGAHVANRLVAQFLPAHLQIQTGQPDKAEWTTLVAFERATGVIDQLIVDAAAAAGIPLQEITCHWPDYMLFWVSAGGVAYRWGSPCGELHWLYPWTNGPLNHMEAVTDAPPILLTQTPYTMTMTTGVTQEFMSPFFVANGCPKDAQYTVGTFAITKYGSNKQRRFDCGDDGDNQSKEQQQQQQPVPPKDEVYTNELRVCRPTLQVVDQFTGFHEKPRAFSTGGDRNFGKKPMANNKPPYVNRNKKLVAASLSGIRFSAAGDAGPH